MTKVVCESRSSTDAARLLAVAGAVQRVRPPGIVRVVSIDERDDGTVVVVTDEPDGDDAATAPSDTDTSVFAAAASALAALHAHGIAHGAVEAAARWRDPAGRAVLPLPAWRDGGVTATVEDDVAALCRLVGERGARSAHALSTRLAAPSPRVLRTNRAPAGARARSSRATTVGALAAVAGVVTMAVALVSPSSSLGPTGSERPTPRRTIEAGPTTTVPITVPASAERTVELDGHRYELGAAGDLVLLGRWWCDPDATPTPALVRPSTGDIFVFGSISDGAGATLVARIDGVTGAGRVAGDAGCDRLVVDTGDGPVDVVTDRAGGPPPRSPAAAPAP